jgi:membrane associated rhomboid family serine protease
MGIYDRDYYRERSGGFLESWGRQGATVWLIIVTCIVFLLQLVTEEFKPSITAIGIYDYDAVRRGEVWRLITPVFLHAGLIHLAFNMLVLYWAGSLVEDIYGSREFLLFYLGAGLFCGTLEFLVHLAGAQPHRGLGASGAVTAVLVVCAFHYPNLTVRLWFILPMRLWLLVALYVGLDILGVFGAGREGIGYLAHLGGALFGFLYYKTGWRVSWLLPGRSSEPVKRAVPRLRVVPAESDSPPEERDEPVGAAVEAPKRPAGAADEQFEARVDAVLEKVSKYGQESLTAEERELLFQASERYKKRRK